MDVVLGAESPLGHALVERLTSGGREVRQVRFRGAAAGPAPSAAEGQLVDPRRLESLFDACRGGVAVYDAYEPAYSEMKKVWPLVSSNVVLAAIEVKATLVLVSPLVRSVSDNMSAEREAIQAHTSGLTDTVVARIPQLYGEGVINPLWKLIYSSVLSNRKAHWIGDPGLPRSLLDVGDAARAIAELEANPRSHGRAWNIACPEVITGRQFMELAFKALERDPQVGSWGRGIVLTGGFLSPEAKEVLRMPYDYYSPFTLPDDGFKDTFPDFRFTAPAESVANGIVWYGNQLNASKLT